MNPNSDQCSLNRWQHFAHDADLGIRGLGATISDAFAQAARALTAAMVDPDAVKPVVSIEIDCAGNDPEDLLYVWLNRIVFEMATRRMIFGRFDVEVHGNTLHATAWGKQVGARLFSKS